MAILFFEDFQDAHAARTLVSLVFASGSGIPVHYPLPANIAIMTIPRTPEMQKSSEEYSGPWLLLKENSCKIQ